jgi:hypothetical protein
MPNDLFHFDAKLGKTPYLRSRFIVFSMENRAKYFLKAHFLVVGGIISSEKSV